MNQTPAELLRKAAQLIVERGWTREVFQSKDGCLCAHGALIVAATGEAPSTEASIAAMRQYEFLLAFKALTDEVKEPFGGIVVWNDTPERTSHEVVTTMARVAEALDRANSTA